MNLSAFVRFHARRTPDRLALVFGGERVSYGALDDRIGRLAGWLAANGVQPGAVVAAFMKNSAAFIELAFAASHLGAIFLPINYRLARDEVAYILGNAEAALLLADNCSGELDAPGSRNRLWIGSGTWHFERRP